MDELAWRQVERSLETLAWAESPTESREIHYEQVIGPGALIQNGDPLFEILDVAQRDLDEIAERYRASITVTGRRVYLARAPHEVLGDRLNEATVTVILPHPGLEEIAFPDVHTMCGKVVVTAQLTLRSG